MEYTNDVSNVRTVTQPSAGSYSISGRGSMHVQVHADPDSILSETERKIINALGGERGEALRRTLISNRKALQGKREHANRIAAAVRFDVEEYLRVLNARFARDFREIGEEIGRRLSNSRKRDSVIRFKKG